MKKVVIIIIGIIYIASVFIVNVFGLQMEVFKPTVYQERIECNTITVHSGAGREQTIDYGSLKDGVKYFSVKFIKGDYTLENLETNPNTIELNIIVYPENATNKNVVITCEDKTSYVLNAAERKITFLKSPVGCLIYIYSADGNTDIVEKIFLTVY